MHGGTSRRRFLGSSAGVALGGVAGPTFFSADAHAQGGAGSDAGLARVQGARRILLKGGVLLTALGMIDMGTTAMVDISQVSHTPEHSDACIRALQESGIRAVFAYHRGAGPLAQYPQDIKRLQRQYFSSKDQLLTLALSANLNAPVFALA